MKITLPVVCSALFLVSCAHMRVTHTDVATGATNPRAIYIRPFSVAYTPYSDPQIGAAAPIRKSLAPAAFADDLQEELSKLAPSMVIGENEFPARGWLVEGVFEEVNAGDSRLRGSTEGWVKGAGRSCLKLHVRVTDLGGNTPAIAELDSKDGSLVQRPIGTPVGSIIYEFDLAGGSGRSGSFGSILAPGFGDAVPFDFRNAAEQIMLTLSPDPFRYGYRSSPSQNL
jgi:hypothetical protein